MKYPKKRNAEEIQMRLFSTRASVAKAVETTRAFLTRFGARNGMEICLIVRELLMNAVEHGNKSVPEKSIAYRFGPWGDGQFRIDIEDEGEGFDYAHLDLTIPEDPRHAPHRGYPLVNALCERIEFNKAGNHVSAYMPVRSEN